MNNNKLPLTTIDWSQKFNKAKIKYMLIAIIVALIITVNTYKLLHRVEHDSELISVVVASQNIEKYTQLTDADMQLRNMRRDQVPENAIMDNGDIRDLTTLINISKGQILTSQFFKEEVNPDSVSAKIGEGMIGMSVGFDWLIAPVPDIKDGDTVDIIASSSYKKEEGTSAIGVAQAEFPVRDAKVLRVVKEGDYEQNGHLILELTQEQAKNLMSTRALKVLLNIIVK